MKRIITILVIACFVLAPITATAGRGGKKGPDDSAYEHASDKAKFKRDGQVDAEDDSAAEIGKDKKKDKGKAKKDKKKKKDNGKKKKE